MKQIHAPMTTERFKCLANGKFPFLDYSKTVFIDSLTKVKFECPQHGLVEQDPYTHLNSKCGCPECGKEDRAIKRMGNRLERLKKDVLNKHGDRYSYHWDTFKGMGEYMTITCSEHGDFEQCPSSHLFGRGCPKCGERKRGLAIRLGRKLILDRFQKIFGNTYEYSLIPESVLHSDYVNVICHKHGEFRVTVANHLKQSGCPVCNESHGERTIRNFLVKNSIPFKPQFSFDDCRYVGKLRFDFCLTATGTLIEYQGRQHYMPSETFGGVAAYEKVMVRDEIKREYCKKNGIRLEEIRFDQNIEARLLEILN